MAKRGHVQPCNSGGRGEPKACQTVTQGRELPGVVWCAPCSLRPWLCPHVNAKDRNGRGALVNTSLCRWGVGGEMWGKGGWGRGEMGVEGEGWGTYIIFRVRELGML